MQLVYRCLFLSRNRSWIKQTITIDLFGSVEKVTLTRLQRRRDVFLVRHAMGRTDCVTTQKKVCEGSRGLLVPRAFLLVLRLLREGFPRFNDSSKKLWTLRARMDTLNFSDCPPSRKIKNLLKSRSIARTRPTNLLVLDFCCMFEYPYSNWVWRNWCYCQCSMILAIISRKTIVPVSFRRQVYLTPGMSGNSQGNSLLSWS